MAGLAPKEKPPVDGALVVLVADLVSVFASVVAGAVVVASVLAPKENPPVAGAGAVVRCGRRVWRACRAAGAARARPCAALRRGLLKFFVGSRA